MSIRSKFISFVSLVSMCLASSLAVAQTMSYELSDEYALRAESQRDVYIEGRLTNSTVLRVYSTRRSVDQSVMTSTALLEETQYDAQTGAFVERTTRQLDIKNGWANGISRLLTLVDWHNNTVVETEFLCDAPSTTVRFFGESQTLINTCGPRSNQTPAVSFEMGRAKALMTRVASRTLQSGEIVQQETAAVEEPDVIDAEPVYLVPAQ